MLRATRETVSNSIQQSAALPSWITDELIAETLDVWSPYYANRLTRDDAVEILRNVGRLVDVLETPLT